MLRYRSHTATNSTSVGARYFGVSTVATKPGLRPLQQGRPKTRVFLRHPQSASGEGRWITPSAKQRTATALGELEQQLVVLRDLTNNWNSYGAPAPDGLARFLAQEAMHIARELGIAPVRIAPSVEGGVALCFQRNALYGQLEIFNDGEIYALFSDGSGSAEAWPVGSEPTELSAALERLRALLAR